MFFMRLKLNNSRDVYDVVKNEAQKEEWQVVIDRLVIEKLHTFKDSTVHNPCEENPRLIIMVSIAPNESSETANEKPNLRRKVFIIDLCN